MFQAILTYLWNLDIRNDYVNGDSLPIKITFKSAPISSFRIHLWNFVYGTYALFFMEPNFVLQILGPYTVRTPFKFKFMFWNAG